MRLEISIVVDDNHSLLLNNVRLLYVFWELRISVTDEKQSFEEWYGLEVCISRLSNNVYIGWMNMVIMADGEDMIITWSRPRESLVRRHRVRTNVLIDVQERATHVKNIEWSRRSLSTRVKSIFC